MIRKIYLLNRHLKAIINKLFDFNNNAAPQIVGFLKATVHSTKVNARMQWSFAVNNFRHGVMKRHIDFKYANMLNMLNIC